MSAIIPVSMPEEQVDSIREVADKLGLSAQDVIRQTVKLYLPEFCERMQPKVDKPGRLSVWEALHWGKRKGELRIPRIPGKVTAVKL